MVGLGVGDSIGTAGLGTIDGAGLGLIGGAGLGVTDGARLGVTGGAGFGLTGGAGTWAKETVAKCVNIAVTAETPSVARRKSLLFMCPKDFEFNLLFGLVAWRAAVRTKIAFVVYLALRTLGKRST
jgi:hypothetical protein